ncbi:dATP/dGTP diphosphohydrolase domain-containing protein [Nitrobacteraceae bacterium UC4449_H16]
MLDPNPKKLMGDKKPPLHLLPLSGMIHQSLAHMDGDLKYGFENWNDKPVEKLTYIGAALRHMELYKYGETYTRDTRVHNLGGVMACCAILIDAELNGNLIDNTKHSKATCDLLHTAEGIVAALKKMQAERELARQAAVEQERCDNSWAQAALDSVPMVDDAGGDAASDDFIACGRCQNLIECSRVGSCLYPTPFNNVGDAPPLMFVTCGKCDDPAECGSKGRCFGR